MQDAVVEGLECCQTKDMLRFLFALCCSGGASTLQPMDIQMGVVLQMVQELAGPQKFLPD